MLVVVVVFVFVSGGKESQLLVLTLCLVTFQNNESLLGEGMLKIPAPPNSMLLIISIGHECVVCSFKKFVLEPKQILDPELENHLIIKFCCLKIGHFGHWRAIQIKLRHLEAHETNLA